ncbi:hypothetical protein TNCV_4634041 [Trichonephila clavipes]|nr:hypothetical protein TNCV_4634041 [Trichonephila clavipes]
MSSKSRIAIIDSVEYQPNFDLLKELEKKSIIPKQISDLKNEVITFIEQEFNDNEHILGGDQGYTPEIMNEILTTARDLEFEVNEDDI